MSTHLGAQATRGELVSAPIDWALKPLAAGLLPEVFRCVDNL